MSNGHDNWYLMPHIFFRPGHPPLQMPLRPNPTKRIREAWLYHLGRREWRVCTKTPTFGTHPSNANRWHWLLLPADAVPAPYRTHVLLVT